MEYKRFRAMFCEYLSKFAKTIYGEATEARDPDGPKDSADTVDYVCVNYPPPKGSGLHKKSARSREPYSYRRVHFAPTV